MHDEDYSISVIIPTFNRAQYLPCAIDSVLAQNYSPCEIIVVDDGSTDNTKAVLEHYNGKIRYIKKRNGGVSSARNAGIQAARHRWIAFLDSDDEWMEGKLVRQIDDLTDHPNAIAHFTNVDINREFATENDCFSLRQFMPAFACKEVLYLDRPLRLSIDYNFGRVQSALVHRDAITRSGGFDSKYNMFEDADFINRVAFEGPWVICAKSYVREIRRDEAPIGLGLQRYTAPHIGYDNLFQQMLELLTRQGLNPDEQRSLKCSIAKYGVLSASAYMKQGDRFKAREHAVTAMRHQFSLKASLYFAASFFPVSSCILRKR